MKGLARLTTEERVGQLFFLGFQGAALDRDTIRTLDKVRPGGIVSLQRNIESLDQIYELNAELWKRAETPPFLAIGQEGGIVDRLKHVLTPIPSVADLADLGLGSVRSGARLIAAELVAAGFNTNLFPILDLGLADSIVRERCLGAAPAVVVRTARAVLDEFARKGIVSCGAHFPGLGGAGQDPHFVLPRVGRTRRQILSEDVVPFAELAGQLDMIMISNAHYPSLGDIRPLPASLSRRVIRRVLRETVGFQGITLTSDLTMGAITATGLTPDTFLDAIRAGNDMVLFSQTTPLVQEAFDRIVHAARTDRALLVRIDESVERVLAVKRKLEFAPLRNRARVKSRLVRQIERLKSSIPDVERVRVR
jgi:beta-N-acetylhexosaminidase